MSAYGTSQNQLHALPHLTEEVAGGSVVDVLVTQLAERVAALVVDRLSCVNNQEARRSGSTPGMLRSTSESTATHCGSLPPSGPSPPSRTDQAASSTSAGPIWKRGAKAVGARVSSQRPSRWPHRCRR
jgi:hypothetical protein